jgi:hypothetical protein
MKSIEMSTHGSFATGKGVLQALWLNPRLCFHTSYAFITYTLHIVFHFRSIKMFIQHIQSLNNQNTPMCFKSKQFTHRTWWNTQTTLFKQIFIKSIELPKSWSFASIVNISKKSLSAQRQAESWQRPIRGANWGNYKSKGK